MKIGDEEYKRELKKYLDERKPSSFGSMVESMSWYTRTRKEFIKKHNLEEVEDPMLTFRKKVDAKRLVPSRSGSKGGDAAGDGGGDGGGGGGNGNGA